MWAFVAQSTHFLRGELPTLFMPGFPKSASTWLFECMHAAFIPETVCEDDDQPEPSASLAKRLAGLSASAIRRLARQRARRRRPLSQRRRAESDAAVAQHVVAPHEAAVEESESWCHQQHERRRVRLAPVKQHAHDGARDARERGGEGEERDA